MFGKKTVEVFTAGQTSANGPCTIRGYMNHNNITVHIIM
jgi:hypothetical protein